MQCRCCSEQIYRVIAENSIVYQFVKLTATHSHVRGSVLDSNFALKG